MTRTPRPSYREITGDQWKAFSAAFLGWVLDGFDFNILLFLLADIQRSFGVSKAAIGALGTVTLLCRVVGGISAGTAADRWGRKAPLIASILWYSLFAFLSGFSTSYAMLFAFRALFGIGMGGVWAAGMPLTLEHWPARLRGTASGLLQSGYSVGFLLATLVFQFTYPLVSGHGDLGWRVLLWLGVLPAFLVVWMVSAGVKESPIWLERQQRLRERRERDGVSLVHLFRRGLLPVTLQTSGLMGAFIFSYHSITYWYPTFLALINRAPLYFMTALHAGGIVGSILCGWLSETRLGRRGASMLAMAIGVAVTPLFLFATSDLGLWIGALMVGLFAAGAWGIVPGYLAVRFPTEARAAGAGFAYHVGAGLGSFTPYLIGALQDNGMALPSAMAACIAASGVLVIALVWLGPETRGRQFQATAGT